MKFYVNSFMWNFYILQITLSIFMKFYISLREFYITLSSRSLCELWKILYDCSFFYAFGSFSLLGPDFIQGPS